MHSGKMRVVQWYRGLGVWGLSYSSEGCRGWECVVYPTVVRAVGAGSALCCPGSGSC